MTLFFMHITKTAGGSLKEMLRRSGVNVRFHYAEEEGFRKWFWYRPEPEILFGHYLYGAHVHAKLPPRYAAFFREPAARSISHYFHLRDVDPGPAGQDARKYGTFSDYALNAGRWEFDNFMCRVVSGIGNQIRFGMVDQEVLDIALENLRTFEFIGIFEDLQRSIERLNALVTPLHARIPVVNKGSYERRVSDADHEIAGSINSYDAILYQEAVKLAGSSSRPTAKRFNSGSQARWHAAAP